MKEIAYSPSRPPTSHETISLESLSSAVHVHVITSLLWRSLWPSQAVHCFCFGGPGECVQTLIALNAAGSHVLHQLIVQIGKRYCLRIAQRIFSDGVKAHIGKPMRLPA